jgi:hypothetical protein
VNLNPLDGFAVIVMLSEIFDVGAVGFNKSMAVHADVHRRHRSMARSFNGGMAVHAGNIILTCMFFMTEGNGLNGGITLIFGRRHRVIKAPRNA